MNRLLLSTLIALGLSTATVSAAEKTLTVYTYDSFVSEWGPGPAIKKAFEERCDCNLNFVAAGDGAALLGRVQLEGRSTKADIVLGLDTSLMARARKTGYFAPHDADLPASNVPGGWEDTQFVPYDWGHFAFVYDTTRLENPPKSFDDLLNAPDDVTIIIQDPRTSTPGLGLLLWVKHVYGDRAGEVWEKLSPRIVTVTKGWWEAYEAFLGGEAAMALSYTTSPAYHSIVEEDETKKAAAFEDGHYVQIEIAGRLASSDEPELAQDFLQFIASKSFQDIIPTTNWMYPAFETAAELPSAFGDLVTPVRSLHYDPDEARAKRNAALEEWLDALSR